MLVTLDILARDGPVDGVGVADYVGMANLGHELLQPAVVSHPVRAHLHQPAHPLGPEVELARHAALPLGVLRIEAATAAQIARTRRLQRSTRGAARAEHTVREQEELGDAIRAFFQWRHLITLGDVLPVAGLGAPSFDFPDEGVRRLLLDAGLVLPVVGDGLLAAENLVARHQRSLGGHELLALIEVRHESCADAERTDPPTLLANDGAHLLLANDRVPEPNRPVDLQLAARIVHGEIPGA